MDEDATPKDEAPKDATPKSGKALGGHARAAKLSKQQRSDIAKHAAEQRWASVPEPMNVPRVLESFKSKLKIAGIEIPCAVVMGPNGVQRVLSENGITNAILGNRSGASKRKKKTTAEEGAPIPIFVAPRQLSRCARSCLGGP